LAGLSVSEVSLSGGSGPAVPVPAVSVIVPAYGVADLLGEALASLQRQSFTDWEAIVVDDGAPDDVAGAVARFAGDPRIRLLATDNQGVATARARAIAAARAPILALLDGDDQYEADYLATMVAAIGEDPGIGFVCCDATLFGAVAREGQAYSARTAQVPPVTLARVLTRDFNVFTAATIRREAFVGAGGYDPALRTAEDFDLWIRILESGWTARYVPRRLARYRRRSGSLSTGIAAMLPMVAAVYAKAEARLAGRPEAAIATRMRAEIERVIAWETGDAMIRDGRVREGLALLHASGIGHRSPRWRIAMPLLRAMPALARPLLRYRWRQQQGQ
jgi:glycosyltransferase involved in cell wall biosynthesis